MKKKSVGSVMLTVLFFLVILSYGQPSHADESDFLWSDNNDGTVTITGYKNSASRDMVIPDTLGGKTVTGIGWYALSNKQLTNVSLPDSLTSIENGAFSDNLLTNVILPNSLTEIRSSVFYNNLLTNVSLPNSLTEIGDFAFRNNQLTNISLPDKLESIGEWAFENNLLTNISLPEKLTSIGNAAFQNNKLTNVSLPDKLASIERLAFANNKLTDVSLPDSLTSIGDSAFYNNKLTNVSLSDKMTSIEDGLFSNNLLTNVSLPDKLTSIGNSTFSNNKLTNISLPDKLTSIGDFAFSDNLLTNVSPPDSLTSIGNSAFYNNLLTNISLPDSLTSIGDHAFYNNLLTNISLPDKLTSIEDFAFSNNLLTSVSLPDELASIGRAAFSDNKLTNVTMPDKLTSIRDEAFSNNQLTNVSLPDSLTNIGRAAFSDNQLTNVTMPDSLTSIGYRAFQNNKLTNVSLPDKLTSIGDQTFQNNQLTNVSLPDELTSIGYLAFQNNQLTNITLPNKLTSIGYGVFGNNPLISVTLTSNISNLSDISLSYLLKKGHAFGGWYTDSTFTTEWDKVPKSGTLYAKWTINEYIVTFDSQGGSAVDSAKADYDTQINAPTEPTKPGHTFVGWFTDTALTKPWDFATDTVQEDITLYAKWVVEIDDVQTLTDIHVPFGTDITSIALPQTVTVKLGDTTTKNITIVWNGSNPVFDGNTPGNYAFTGDLTLPLGVTNPQNLPAKVNVIVRAKPSGGGGGGGSYIPSNNNELQELKVLLNGQMLTLTPNGLAFTLKTDTSEIELFPKTAQAAAKVTLNGSTLAEGQKVPLQEGSNVFELTVEAENGTKRTYTLTIQRTTTEPEPVEPVEPIEFSDTAGHWADDYIKQAATLGIIKGYPDGTFKPNNPLTRAQTASIIVRALNLQTGEAAPFKDIGYYDDETQAEIAAAYQFGIIKGSNGNFNPSNNITRAQIALMIHRVYEYKTGTKYEAAKAPYSDFGKYDAETVNAISMLHELGIATGSEGKFNPSNPTTRAHAAKILVNLLESLK